MRKLIDLGSLTCIAVALGVIAYLFLPSRPAQASSAGAFKDFPVGVARAINLSASRDALEELTPREQADQVRDWLLFSVVSAAGVSAEDANTALFDLPPIRHGLMRPVANFEYGDTRSCYIGDGRVLALVPAGASEERAEQLARIADEHRKNLGETPTRLLLFEYELKPADDPARLTALLTRRDAVNVPDLFKPAAGYHEAKISSLDDLKHFMGQVDDLTYVSLKDGLTVGGRKIKGHAYRGIRVEEVAALYQSEAKLREGRQALKRKADEYKARCTKLTYRFESEREEWSRSCALEGAALEKESWQARKAGGLVGGSGFSLDPAYDYAKLAAKFDSEIAPKLRPHLSGDTSTTADGDDPLAVLPVTLRGGPVEQKIKKARDGLARSDAGPLLKLLGEVKDTEVAGEIENTVNEGYGYQKARYDGELQGTEVGMVLFYTDLLAKLWAINFQSSAPSVDVADFLPMTVLPVSSIYKEELSELRETRLWFGPQDKGYQVADDGGSLLFGRTSTRVYAASSNPFKPGEEGQPNALSAAFLGWWDDHYDEIARFEPEYERLNEIMKWSLVITWLNQREEAGKLGFLREEKVERGNWFPDWVKQRPLSYTAWDKIKFHPRGGDGTTTESLPILYSDHYLTPGRERPFSGGVSLAREGEFASRAALSPRSPVAQLARRSNLNYAPAESGGSALKTLEGASYRFTNSPAGEAVTTATAKAGSKLRSHYGEAANEAFARTVRQADDGMSFGARVGDVPYGELKVASAENGFSVGWSSRDMGTGASLGRRLSASGSPEGVLRLDPGVETAYALPGDGVYLVKLAGSERWLKATREVTPSASLESGYAARVGGFKSNAKNYNLTWVGPEDASATLGAGGARQLRTPANNNYPAVAQMRRGEYRATARQVVQAPDEFKAQLDSHRVAALTSVKAMMRDGQYRMAGQQLDELIRIHGPRQELRLHKLVVELNVSRQTRQSLTELVTNANRPTLPDEMVSRVNGEFSSRGGNEVISLTRKGEVYALECEFPNLGGEQLTREAASQIRKALVYVQDTPGLNNLDWQVSPQRTLDAAISGEFQSRVIVLPRSEVARFKPSTIYDRSEGVTYRAAGSGGSGGSGLIRPRYFGGGRGRNFLPPSYTLMAPCFGDDDEDDDSCDDDEDTKIIIVRR